MYKYVSAAYGETLVDVCFFIELVKGESLVAGALSDYV